MPPWTYERITFSKSFKNNSESWHASIIAEVNWPTTEMRPEIQVQGITEKSDLLVDQNHVLGILSLSPL